jgi:hypothetical protein
VNTQGEDRDLQVKERRLRRSQTVRKHISVLEVLQSMYFVMAPKQTKVDAFSIFL